VSARIFTVCGSGVSFQQSVVTMASRSADSDVALAPAETSTAYDRDFYSWLMEQARLVREGRWDELDRDNLAEEIKSLGREQFTKLEKRAARAPAAHPEMGSSAEQADAKLGVIDRSPAHRVGTRDRG
jgi:Domain of unknown function DUF29